MSQIPVRTVPTPVEVRGRSSCRNYYRPLALPFLLVGMAILAGCRPQDPPTQLATNLGTADRPLLPTTRRHYDEAILTGKAAPVRAEQVVARPPQEPSADEGAPQELVDQITEAARTAMRTLLEGRYNDLAELMVPEQREAVGRLAEKLARAMEANTNLMTALNEKMPAVASTLGAAMSSSGMLGTGIATPEQAERITQMVQVTGLRMQGADRASGTMMTGPQGLPCSFRRVEGQWLLDVSLIFGDSDVMTLLDQALETIGTQLEALIGRINDGGIGPEALMPELMKIGQAMAPVAKQLAEKFANQGQGTPAEAAPDESEDATDTAQPDDEAPDAGEPEADEPKEEEPPPSSPPSRGRGRIDGIG